MSEIKSCPFCGGDGSLNIEPKEQSIYCSCWVCGARGMAHGYEDDRQIKDSIRRAIESWNTRVDFRQDLDKVLDKIVEQLEELQGMYNCAEKMYNIADVLDMAIEIVRKGGVR